MPARSYGQYCPVAKTLELVGERWTLLIVRELLVGPQRFTDLHASLEGIPRNPAVISVRARQAAGPALPAAPAVLGFDELRELCLAAGADDVGFVEVTRPEIADQKADIDAVFPHARTLIGFVCRMNQENIRT